MFGSIAFSGLVKYCTMLDVITFKGYQIMPSQLSDLHCSIMLECTGQGWLTAHIHHLV